MNMMSKLTIRKKLTVVIMLTTALALLLAGTIFVVASLYLHREESARDINSLADVIGRNCEASLAFSIPEDAEKILAALEARASIIHAVLYDSEGEVFAVYDPAGQETDFAPPKPIEDGHDFKGGHLGLFRQIYFDEKVIGTIYIQDDMRDVYQSLKSDVATLAIVMLAALVAAYFIAWRLQGVISGPIVSLSETAADITEKEDYSIRAEKTTEDEVGLLMDSFNKMLDEVQNRDAALRESQQRYRAVVEDQTELLCRNLPDYTITFVNDAYCKYFGKTREELIGSKFTPAIPAEDHHIVEDHFASLSPENPTDTYQHRVAMADGQIRWNQWTNHAIVNDEGEIIEYQGVGRDITERIAAQHALSESEERFRDFFENAPIGFHLFGPDETIIDINDAELEMIGYSRQEVVGTKKWQDLIVPEQMPMLQQHWEDMKTKGHVRNVEYSLVHKQGHLVDVVVNASSRFDANGNLINTRGSVINVTERKRAEADREQLLKTVTAKNKELQSIVYVASHDLRSPLVNIEGFGGELMKSCQQLDKLMKDAVFDETKTKKVNELIRDEIPEALGFIKAGTTKMSSLLAGLLQVSRVGTTTVEIRPLDMNKMMAGIRQFMEFQINDAGAELVIKDMPACLGDEAMINQVFSNIIGNALKYLDPDRKGEMIIQGHIENGHCIYCVEDNGIGINPVHQRKIFELFHRLNPNDSAGGEGLGLTIITRILDRLNGNVWVESEPGKGSKFFVSLPTA
jgi:PAS domain S-box-containing protein